MMEACAALRRALILQRLEDESSCCGDLGNSCCNQHANYEQ